MEKFVECTGGILAFTIVVVGQELDILSFVGGKPCNPLGRVGHIRSGEGYVRDGLPQRVSVCAVLTNVVVIAIANVATTFLAGKQVGLVADFKSEQIFLRRRRYSLRLVNRVFQPTTAQI